MTKELLKELIRDKEKEITKAEFYVWYHKRELRNPVKMGKKQAQEGIDIWKGAIKMYQEQIQDYKDYAKSLNYVI